eukprot:Skav220336  [mRNA]  locus=scaffold4823:4519:11876:- [translate_table: standard]
MYATGNTTWSVSMGLDQSMYAEDCNAGYEEYGNYDYEETGDYYQRTNEWMYYMDDMETTDGSYTPSEVETMAAGRNTTVNDLTVKSTNFSAGQTLGCRLATSPCGAPCGAAMAVPGTEPMKVQLPAEARGLPPLHPSARVVEEDFIVPPAAR